ncbi:MAG: hypothetical protein EAZ82_12230 [Verrucomicrobia bacterium]|nr:MAG: hypothetical protein EAZ82_12230 [Verrucomicrobiota bacterium]
MIGIIILIVFLALLGKALFETAWGSCQIIWGVICQAFGLILLALACVLDFFEQPKAARHGASSYPVTHMRTTIALLATLLVTTLPGLSQEPTKPGAEKPTQTETQPAGTLPAARTITDTKGRAMVGVIVSKTDKAITFERSSDKKRFEITLDTLSDADKAFVAGLHTPQPPAPIPFQIEHGMWIHHYGTYALIRVEGTIYAIYATGVDGERPDMKRTPGDDCYYSIQYSITKITPGRPQQVITKAIDHELAHEHGVLNFLKFKLEWAPGNHDKYRIGYSRYEMGTQKVGPPPGTEYYSLLLPTLDSIKELEPNRWLPVPTVK